MSFSFLPLYTGDYLRDTRHLSPLRHGVYLLLLMHCWDQQGPVPLDEQEAAGIANCRSSDEIDALRYVLEKYFIRMDDGWYNRRMQREIERGKAISRARAQAGRKGHESKHLPSKCSAIAEQVPSKCSAIAEQVPLHPQPQPQPQPQPYPQPPPLQSPPSSLSPPVLPQPAVGTKKTNARVARSAPAAPVDVAPQVWIDWTALRKSKRAAATETALAGIRHEAQAAGLTLEAALRICCERGWAGFRAEWVKSGTTRQSIEERNAAHLAEFRRRNADAERTIEHDATRT